MSIAIKKIYTRPSLDVDFYKASPELSEHEYKTYIEPGHILFKQGTFSEDKLTQVTFIVFADRESRILYLSDPHCIRRAQEREEYNSKNNIKVETFYMMD
jgi:hypothetical protein